jgi:hypothetical protein
MQIFNEEKMLALFSLANIKIHSVWRLPNYYFENCEDEVGKHIAKTSPHWLVKTDKGLIRLGWRKRVLEIDWTDTKIEKIVTEDEVTKNEHLVHAYTIPDAVKYLQSLAEEINKC